MMKTLVLNRQHGFSLLELMAALAIAGILTAVAMPSYLDHVKRTRRGDAQAGLLALASAMERYYVDNHTFVGANPATLYSAKTPVDGDEVFYTLAIQNATRRNFTLTATPKNAQLKDDCGQLTLTRSGVRGVVGATAPLEDCWRG